MEYIQAKTIISKTKSTNWFGTDYNMNIYKGCSHGCIYCDSRSDCYNVNDFDTVRAKENAIAIIRNDLRKKAKKGVIGTGSMSDPYNPFEEELQLTRNSLELINAYKFGVAIATKSPLIKRDIDVLQAIKSHSPVIVKMTITTSDDKLCKMIEPNVAVSSERFKAIKELSTNNIYCGILLMPLLPLINDDEDNLIKLIQLAKENGAKFVYPGFGVTLRNNQREHFYEKLDILFPNLKDDYIKRYANSYNCPSPKANQLYQLFTKECDKIGLLYKMQDIINNSKIGYGNRQLSLFD